MLIHVSILFLSFWRFNGRGNNGYISILYIHWSFNPDFDVGHNKEGNSCINSHWRAALWRLVVFSTFSANDREIIISQLKLIVVNLTRCWGHLSFTVTEDRSYLVLFIRSLCQGRNNLYQTMHKHNFKLETQQQNICKIIFKSFSITNKVNVNV